MSRINQFSEHRAQSLRFPCLKIERWGSQLLILAVDRRVAFGACLPAAVDPEPLVRVAANPVFDDFGETGGVFEGVLLVVSGGDEVDGFSEMEDVLLLGLLPEHESGKDGGSGSESDAGHAGCGAGEASEKWHE